MDRAKRACLRATTRQTAGVYEAPVRCQALVMAEIRPDLFEVRLPNGKISLGHLSKDLKESGTSPVVGGKVELELTPFDFDSARIASLVD